MDHEKKYNEALERARALWQEAIEKEYPNDYLKDYETIFPELRESEDERMRKRAIAILKYQRDYWSYDGPMDKCPPATPRKDLVDAIDVALSYLKKQKEQNEITIEQVYEEFINPEKLKDAKTNKYIRAQLLWELMHNGIITEVDYQYLTDDKRKPWTAEEYRIAYQKGFDMSEQLKQKEQKPWSEEDEDMLNSCISSIEEAKENRYAYKETDGDTSYDHEIAWLKSLRPS